MYENARLFPTGYSSTGDVKFRDFVAALCLAGNEARSDYIMNEHAAADRAVRLADALIAELEKE